jgi:hypothetical protein
MLKNKFKGIITIITMLFVVSCTSSRESTIAPVTHTPIPATPTRASPTITHTLPAPTQLPTSPTTQQGTEVPIPVLFERSAQELGMQETVQAALGDLDGDGDLDAVFANPMRNYSQVWLNDSFGKLVNTGQQLTQYGHGVGLADFDLDGDLDAFIVCHQVYEGSKIYLNNGTGVFTENGQNLEDTQLSAIGVDLIDINGDGQMDAHVAYYDPSGLPDKVYLNNGKAIFTDSGLALDEDVIAWGDLDMDGDVDYFGKRWGTGYVVRLNDGRGNFVEGWSMADAHSTIGGIALADFDDDGDLDALVTNGHRTAGSFPSLLLLNSGEGQFSDSGERMNDTLGAELAVGDLDLDGDLDVFNTNSDLPNEVWLNDQGRFTDSGLRLGEVNDVSGRPSLGDLDGDGDLDAIVGRFQGGAQIWFNTTLSSTAADNGEVFPAELIAFSSNMDGDFDIWVMNSDGSNPQQLTNDPANDSGPDWSSDGSKIVFISQRNGNSDIFVMDADGSHLNQLTDSPADDFWPVWSPDGEQILFNSRTDNNTDIYVMRADGSDIRQLTDTPASEDFAAWSPDGSQIIYARIWGEDGTYLMDANGANQQKITDIVGLEFAWSPDGMRIAFGSDYEGNRRIYVMDADGSNIHRLLSAGPNTNGPDWSPDGTRIVFISWQDGDGDIYIMNADGSNLQKLTNNQYEEEFPAWQP